MVPSPLLAEDKPTGKVIRESGRSVRVLAYSSDGRRVFIAGIDKTLEVRDAASGNVLIQTRIKGIPRCLAVSPDGKTIACGVSSRDIFLLNPEDLTLKGTLKGHTFAVKSIDFSPDGSQILSASDDMTLRLWNKSGDPIRTFTGHFSLVTGARFLADGKHIVSASMDGTLRVWDIKTGKEVRRTEVSTDGLVCLVPIAARSGVATASRNGWIYTAAKEQLK